MSKICNSAIKHMLEIRFLNQYIIEFYESSFEITTEAVTSSLESIDSLSKAIDEINKILDEKEKFESIVSTIFKLDNLSERILSILNDEENYDSIMIIFLCNYIEELYKDFKDRIGDIIENLLKLSTIPKLTNMINDLNKKICDLESVSIDELLNDSNSDKSYKFNNDEENK